MLDDLHVPDAFNTSSFVEEARRHARRLSDQAAEHLGRFGASADALRAVAAFVVERRH